MDNQNLEIMVKAITNGTSDPRFEQLLNGVVYELFFPEDLHSHNIHLFDASTKADLAALSGLQDEALTNAAQSFLDQHLAPGSPIRGMLSDLQTLDVVRIIERDK